MKATAQYGIHNNKKIGKFLRVNYRDNSFIYLYKGGLIFSVPKKKFKKEWNKKDKKNFEVLFSYVELDILMQALSKAKKEWKDFENKKKIEED